MEAWVFIVILAVMAVGIGAGFAIGRSTNSAQRRSEALESEISELREQMSGYRQQVGQHFAETADVVNAMTANYRALYDHLSKGAQELCGEQFTSSKLDSSDMRFIEHSSEEAAGHHAPGTRGEGDALAGAAAAATAAGQGEGHTADAGQDEAPGAQAATAGPSHIADAMEKSAQAGRESARGNGQTDEEEFKSEAREATSGNGELDEHQASQDQTPDKDIAGDGGERTAEAHDQEADGPTPSPTVADADKAKRADSTTLH